MSANTATKIPAITQIKGLPPLAVMALQAIKETLEVREGLHEPLDRFVSVRELADLILDDEKIVTYLGSGHNHDARYYTETEWNLTAKGDLNVAQGAGVPGTLGAGTPNQLIRADSGATLGIEYFSLLGTSNQVTVTHNASDATLSLPQNIHSGASPTFAALTLSNNLMLSGNTNVYIKSDTHAAGYSSIYLQGAGTTQGSVVAIGTGATSTGTIFACYGGAYSVNHIEIHHNGSDGYLNTGAGNLILTPTGDVFLANGKVLYTDEVRARDSGGLYLRDDSGTLGIFIKDGGQIGFGTSAPSYDFHFVKSNSAVTTSYGTLRSELSFSGNIGGGNISHYSHVFETSSTVVGTQADGTQHSLYGVYIKSGVNASGNTYENRALTVMASLSHTTNMSSLIGADLLSKHGSTGTVTESVGTLGYSQNSGAGTITYSRGLRGEVWNTGVGTIVGAAGVVSKIWRNAGTITSGYLYYGSYDGTVGTKWGIYLSGETQNYLTGRLGIGVSPPANALLALNTPTEDTEFIDAGSAGATELDWIEVEIGGNTGYIRVFAAK